MCKLWFIMYMCVDIDWNTWLSTNKSHMYMYANNFKSYNPIYQVYKKTNVLVAWYVHTQKVHTYLSLYMDIAFWIKQFVNCKYTCNILFAEAKCICVERFGTFWNQVPMQKASVDQGKVITNELVTITGNLDLFTFHMHVSKNTSVKVCRK